MREGLIKVNAVGVYRSGNVAFDVSYDSMGEFPVELIDWGVFEDWSQDKWKTTTSGGNFHQSGGNVLLGDNLTLSRRNCISLVNVSGNIKVEADVNVIEKTTNPEGQLLIRYKDEGNYYFAGIGAYGYRGAIGKTVASTSSLIAKSFASGTKMGINLNKPYDVRLEAMNDYLFLYIDNKLECWVKDVTHKTGNVGLSTYKSKVSYDNFKAIGLDGSIKAQDNFGDYVKEKDFYIVNKELTPIECTAKADNVLPVELTANMDISWDLVNPIVGNGSKKVKLKMEIFPEAPSGDFTYSLIVTGKAP